MLTTWNQNNWHKISPAAAPKGQRKPKKPPVTDIQEEKKEPVPEKESEPSKEESKNEEAVDED